MGDDLQRKEMICITAQLSRFARIPDTAALEFPYSGKGFKSRRDWIRPIAAGEDYRFLGRDAQLNNSGKRQPTITIILCDFYSINSLLA